MPQSRAVVEEVGPNAPQAIHHLPNGSMGSFAKSVRGWIRAYGSLEFDIEHPDVGINRIPADEKVRVSMSNWAKRDPENTFLLLKIVTDYTYEESVRYGLGDPDFQPQ